MSFFVYIHTCPNHKRYVGITIKKPELRWCNGRGYRKNIHFTNAINKYGWDNIEHEVFETKSVELMSYWERILIYHYNTMDTQYGYNKTGGGENIDGLCLSDDTKKKISTSKKGTTPWNKGKHSSEETRHKISESLKGNQRALGHRLSCESKKKVSESLKGREQSEETKQKRAAKHRGRKRSEETKKKMSDSMKGKNIGKTRSAEARQRISESMKLYWENKRKNNK